MMTVDLEMLSALSAAREEAVRQLSPEHPYELTPAQRATARTAIRIANEEFAKAMPVLLEELQSLRPATAPASENNDRESK